MLYDLWDIFQQHQISSATSTAESAQREVTRTDLRLHSEVQRLESKIDALALVCQSLIELLRDQGGISESEIQAKISEIDLRDGRRDGRISGRPTACPQCHRPAHTRQRVCMYCGTTIAEGMLLEKPYPKESVERGAGRSEEAPPAISLDEHAAADIGKGAVATRVKAP
jgi:hypothetical protein